MILVACLINLARVVVQEVGQPMCLVRQQPVARIDRELPDRRRDRVAATSSMSTPPAADTMKVGAWLDRSTKTPTYASVSMSSAGVTRTFSTVRPLMSMPRMASRGSSPPRRPPPASRRPPYLALPSAPGL